MTSERIDVYDIVERLRWSSMVRAELKGCEYADPIIEHLWRKKMATRSKVAVLITFMEDDPLGINPMERTTYLASYVHWDGNPETRYPLLREYYNTCELAKQLVELGDCSSIGPTLKDAVVYDDNDGPSGPNSYGSFNELMVSTDNSMGEFLYLFIGGKWQVYDVRSGYCMTKKCEMEYENLQRG